MTQVLLGFAWRCLIESQVLAISMIWTMVAEALLYMVRRRAPTLLATTRSSPAARTNGSHNARVNPACSLSPPQFLYPDLGCADYTNQEQCEGPTSPYDPTQPACYWDATLEIACNFYAPDASNNFSPRALGGLILAMLAVDPFIIFIEYLFVEIVNAPRARSRSPQELAAASDQQR